MAGSVSAWGFRTEPSWRAGTGRPSITRWPRCASTWASSGPSSGEKIPPAGEKWRTGFRLVGLDPRPDIPLFVAALSPAMLQLAGEIGDGVMLWLCNPNYIRDVVMPAVKEGRERAGRTLDGFEIVAAVPGALTGDPSQAFEAIRGELMTYFSLPFYRTMLERSGYGADIAAFDAAHGDVDKARAAISDEFLIALTAVGDEQAVRAGVGRYANAGVTLPCLGPISKTDFEATLRAGAPAG